jgi:hydroxymethylpyrimidine pyrophosphatase-like HAD family hydrolase
MRIGEREKSFGTGDPPMVCRMFGSCAHVSLATSATTHFPSGILPMSRTPWRYLLVDVDGTLLDSQARISPRSRAVLARAVEAGVTLVLASGRTYPSLTRAAAGLDLPYHLIANGGAVGMTPGQADVPYVNPLPATLWREVVAAMQDAGLPVVVFGHRHPEPPLLHVARPEGSGTNGDAHFAAYVRRNTLSSRVESDLRSAQVAAPVEVAALGRGPEFERASAAVMARFEGRTRHHCMTLFINAEYGKITEFFHPETNKWRAFRELFPEALAEQVIAVGDEANDAEMIASAGLGIAMGNATPELKALADQVTRGHDQDGLAEALEPIFGG